MRHWCCLWLVGALACWPTPGMADVGFHTNGHQLLESCASMLVVLPQPESFWAVVCQAYIVGFVEASNVYAPGHVCFPPGTTNDDIRVALIQWLRLPPAFWPQQASEVMRAMLQDVYPCR